MVMPFQTCMQVPLYIYFLCHLGSDRLILGGGGAGGGRMCLQLPEMGLEGNADW